MMVTEIKEKRNINQTKNIKKKQFSPRDVDGHGRSFDNPCNGSIGGLANLYSAARSSNTELFKFRIVLRYDIPVTSVINGIPLGLHAVRIAMYKSLSVFPFVVLFSFCSFFNNVNQRPFTFYPLFFLFSSE